MTDTVNVPRDPTEAMLKAWDDYRHNSSGVKAWSALLAAAPKAEPVSDPYKLEPMLWSMHILGPDDMYPAPDLATAFKWCEYVNSELAPRTPDVLLVAIPVLWDGSPEQHAKSLPDAIKGWTVPARPEAPKVEQEPVGIATDMAGTNGGFTKVVFEASSVPAGTKLYTTPAPSSDELLVDIARDAAERVHKNGGCVPQLAYAPILFALQDGFAKHKGPQS